MGVSGTAREALEAVQQLGGETSSHAVSRRLRIETGYARLLCLDLAREDYLDLKPSGLFKMTRKGEQARKGEASASASLPGKAASGKDQTQLDLGWRVTSGCSQGPAQRGSFSKPGQEPLCWHSVKADGTGSLVVTGPAARTATVLDEGTWPCGFCRGKGERPAGARCPVCRGTGMVSLSPPVARCAFCKGKGEEKVRSNVTCTVCRGKGYVEVGHPAGVCARCKGTGKEKNNKLPCLGCKGKGLAAERPSKGPQRKENPEHRLDLWQREELRLKIKQAGAGGLRGTSVSGTELEVLTAYCEAEDRGESPDIPRRTHLTDGYVEMLREKLCEKGLLTSVGSGRYHTTELGKEKVELAKAKKKRKAIHGS